MMPKALKNVIGKVDIRVKPPRYEVKKFKEGCGRRYMNVGIATRDFFNGVADTMNDNELREHAKEIEQAVYTKDGDNFELYKKLYIARMQELGAWKSTKGITKLQKIKIMAKLGRLAKKQKRGGA